MLTGYDNIHYSFIHTFIAIWHIEAPWSNLCNVLTLAIFLILWLYTVCVYTAYTVRVLLLSSTPHRHLFSVNMLRQIHCTLPAQHDMAATINKPVAAEESQGQKWGSELVNSARFLLFYISVVNTKLVFLCSPVEYSNILYLLLPSWNI